LSYNNTKHQQPLIARLSLQMVHPAPLSEVSAVLSIG
jgi:hypothetical protein